MSTGWAVKRLAEISTITYGYTESACEKRVGPKFLRITDIQNNRVDWDSVPFCKIGIPEVQRYRLATGDIVFARTGATTGKSFLIEDPPDSVCASYLIRLRLRNGCLLPRFVSLFFQSDTYWKSIREGSTGSAQGELMVPVPPLPEQRHIVSVLDKAFAAIAVAELNAEKSIRSARAFSRSCVYDLFAQRSLSCEVRKLGEVCELISGQHIDACCYNTERRGVGYLTGPSDFGRVNPIVTKWTKEPKRMAQKGDILITVKGAGVGKINILAEDKVAISRQLMALRSRALNHEHLYLFMSTKLEHFQSLARGAAIPGVSREDVLELPCPVLPTDELPAFLETARRITRATDRLEATTNERLRLVDMLKKSLLHEAFSGRL